MRQRSIAAAQQADVQPTAILGAMGMITLLMLMWLGLVL
jgi:hypothetical protein